LESVTGQHFVLDDERFLTTLVSTRLIWIILVNIYSNYVPICSNGKLPIEMHNRLFLGSWIHLTKVARVLKTGTLPSQPKTHLRAKYECRAHPLGIAWTNPSSIIPNPKTWARTQR
jgi:hypothetical protein